MEHQEKLQLISNTIKGLIQQSGFHADDVVSEVSSSDDSTQIPLYTFRIISNDDYSLLLGKHGETLKAFEHLVRVLVAKQINERIFISVDVNDYKRGRLDRAVKIANEIAEKVKVTQKAEALLPMGAYERRFIHLELASHKDIATESVGEEPKRRVVIRPYP